MFVFACGSGSEDTLEQPSVSPSDEIEDSTPPETEDDTPSETMEIEINGETITVGTRNLYDAEEIIVYSTVYLENYTDFTFKDMLYQCIFYGTTYLKYDLNTIGVLNGVGKEEGYTRDFLLNPDVEQTWSSLTGSQTEAELEKRVTADFNNPLDGASDCSGVACKVFTCGAINGD